MFVVVSEILFFLCADEVILAPCTLLHCFYLDKIQKADGAGSFIVFYGKYVLSSWCWILRKRVWGDKKKTTKEREVIYETLDN